MKTEEKHLLIGAGIVGLAYAKELKTSNIPYDHIDAKGDIGGIWYDTVYDTVTVLAPKNVTQYLDFPMPNDYPTYPGKKLMHDYLKNYVEHFELANALELKRIVIDIRPIEGNLWKASFQNGETRIYKGVIICNGRTWKARIPRFSGHFVGVAMHSKEYQSPEIFKGKRVCVVGAGASGCDVAFDAVTVGAKKVSISVRTPLYLFPKTVFGIPLSSFPGRNLIKGRFKELLIQGIYFLSGGHSNNVPRPEESTASARKTVNSAVLKMIKSGQIEIRQKIEKLAGNTIYFNDESSEEYDILICATGYEFDYPFLPIKLNRIKGEILMSYGYHFLEDYKGIYFAGWTEPSQIGNISTLAAQLFVKNLKLQSTIDPPLGMILKKMGYTFKETHLISPEERKAEINKTEMEFENYETEVKKVAESISFTGNIALPEFDIQAIQKKEVKKILNFDYSEAEPSELPPKFFRPKGSELGFF